MEMLDGECWTCGSRAHSDSDCPHRIFPSSTSTTSPTAQWRPAVIARRPQSLQRSPPPSTPRRSRPLINAPRHQNHLHVHHPRQRRGQHPRPSRGFPASLVVDNDLAASSSITSGGNGMRERRRPQPLPRPPRLPPRLSSVANQRAYPATSHIYSGASHGRAVVRGRQEGSGAGGSGRGGRGAVMEEGDYRGRHKKVWRLCGPAVMYAAAQNAVEDLASATTVRHGGILVVCGLLARAGGYSFLFALWLTVLFTGGVLWVTAVSPLSPPSLPGPSSLGRTPQKRTRRVGDELWIGAPADGEGETGRRGGGWVLESLYSVRNVWTFVMAVAYVPFVLDVWSQWLFFGLAERVESGWLSLALGVSSAAYSGAVLAAVTSRGSASLASGVEFRFLKMAWYVLLLHASVVLATRWEWGLARRGLSAALLAAASAKMAVVPPRTVERSARYGLAATLGEVLRNTPHEVSTESMLHLAFGRWLLDFWSEPSSFSRTELRNMLLQAVFSVERRELPAVTPVPYVHKMAIDSSSTGGIPDRGDRLVGEQLRPASMEGAMARLAEWLGGPTGRRSEAEIDAEETRLAESVTSLVDALNPGRASCTAFLLFKACPSLCTVLLLLLREMPTLRMLEYGRESVLRLDGVLLLALTVFWGPVAIEAIRVKAIWTELYGRKGDESDGQSKRSADGLTLLLQKSNPPLLQVWKNARLAARCLRGDLPESETETRPVTATSDSPTSSADTIAGTLLDLATSLRADGISGAARWVLRQSLASTTSGGDSYDSVRWNPVIAPARTINRRPPIVRAMANGTGRVGSNSHGNMPLTNGSVPPSLTASAIADAGEDASTTKEAIRQADPSMPDVRSIPKEECTSRLAPHGDPWVVPEVPPSVGSPGQGQSFGEIERAEVEARVAAPLAVSGELPIRVEEGEGSSVGESEGEDVAVLQLPHQPPLEMIAEDEQEDCDVDEVGESVAPVETANASGNENMDTDNTVDNNSNADTPAMDAADDDDTPNATPATATPSSLFVTPQQRSPSPPNTTSNTQQQRQQQQEETETVPTAGSANIPTSDSAGPIDGGGGGGGSGWVTGAGEAFVGAAGGASNVFVGATSAVVDVAGGLVGAIGGAAGGAVGFVVHVGSFGWWGGGGQGGEGKVNGDAYGVLTGGELSQKGDVRQNDKNVVQGCVGDPRDNDDGCGGSGYDVNSRGCCSTVNGWTVRTFSPARKSGIGENGDRPSVEIVCPKNKSEDENCAKPVDQPGIEPDATQKVAAPTSVHGPLDDGGKAVDGIDVVEAGNLTEEDEGAAAYDSSHPRGRVVYGIDHSTGVENMAEKFQEKTESPVEDEGTIYDTSTGSGHITDEDDNTVDGSAVEGDITTDTGITVGNEPAVVGDGRIVGDAKTQKSERGTSVPVTMTDGNDEASDVRVEWGGEKQQSRDDGVDSRAVGKKDQAQEIGKDDGLLAGIAGWTVSTAAALAGGAAIVLLSGFPKVEGGGGGTEHATGKKTHAKDTYNNQDTSKGHLGDSKDSTESVNRS